MITCLECCCTCSSTLKLASGALSGTRARRSFASSSTNFQDLAHLADVGASMSSGTDVALQEVLEELSVPARCGRLRVVCSLPPAMSCREC